MHLLMGGSKCAQKADPCPNMDQRVTHAAITDNKRLGAVLEHIKEMQDKTPPKYPVRTNSEKMGYKPSGKTPGRPSGSRNKKTIVQAAE